MDIAKDKSYQNFAQFSRYSTIPTYYNIMDERYFGGITTWISSDTPYIIHKVEIPDTFDSLALKYYGNPTYYWIIADFNRVHDPFMRPAVGSSIKIPTFSKIQFEQ